MLLLFYIIYSCSHSTLLLLSNFFMMELLPLNFGGRDWEKELRARFSYRETTVYLYKDSKLLASPISGTIVSFLADPGQKLSILCMLFCPNDP